MSGYVGSKRSSSLVSATEITLDGAKLKSSGNSITKSDGTTAVLSESGGVVTLNNGTIGSGVTFPSGSLVDFDFTLETATVTKTTSSDHDTPVIAGGTQISIAVPDGCTAIMTAAGGKIYGSANGTRFNSICTIVYSTNGSDVTTSDTQIIGAETFDTGSSGTETTPGYVSGSYTNSTGSSVTLKWVWAIKGLNSSSYTGQWVTTVSRAAVSLQTLIFRT